MTISAARRFAALLVLVASVTSCSHDAITGPTEPTSADGLLGTGLGGLIGDAVDELLACRVDETVTSTKVIGPDGGTIDVGPHSLHIPRGALTKNVEITATAPAGDRVELQFLPHGLRFERRTALRMSYAECGVVQGFLLRIAYVDPETESILEVLPSLPDLLRQQVYGTTDHFSSYMLAY